MTFKLHALSWIFTIVSAGSLSLCFGQAPAEKQKPLPAGYSIPIVDLTDDEAGLTTVDRESGQYLGHPTAVLLEDDKTILCVYPKGHGRGAIVYKKSTDGGKSWSERLPTPEN